MAGSRLPAWLLAVLLGLLTFLAYQPVWHAGFIWDDDVFLVDNPLIKAGNGLGQFWCTRAPDYVPAVSTILWLEWRLWGNNPLGYHLVNVLLHVASSVLLWRVLARLRIPGAWLAAAIFALHPVNVESVAWITERKNTLAMFFYAWALLWYLGFEDTGRRRWYWLALGAFALALLSKPAVVPLPLVLLGLAWWRRGQVNGRDLLRCSSFFIAAAASAAVATWVQYYRNTGSMVRTDILWSRLAGAGWAAWFYLYKALWPLKLTFVYPRWSIDALEALSYLPGLLAGAVGAVCWHYRRQWGRPAAFALGYFVVMLLPVLGFLNIYFMRYSLVADHWQYFAIPGPIALLAAALAGAGEPFKRANPRLRVALGGAVLLVLGGLTWKQTRIYADEEALWHDTLANNPACRMAHTNLGLVLLRKGQADEAVRQYRDVIRLQPESAEAHSNLGIALLRKGQVDEAITQFQEALRLQPDDVHAHNGLGNALARKGQVDEAIGQYQEALRLEPNYAEAHNNLGYALARKGEIDSAISQYREALRLDADFAEAHTNLGNAFAGQGQMDEAIGQFREALRLNPDDGDAHNSLGNALARKGQIDEAIRQYQEAVHLQPDDARTRYNLGIALHQRGQIGEAIRQYQEALRLKPNYAEAHNNLGAALDQKGQPDEAIGQYEEAIRLKPDYAEAHNNLGLALAGKGQTEEAIRQYREAIRLKPDYTRAQSNLARALGIKTAPPGP